MLGLMTAVSQSPRLLSGPVSGAATGAIESGWRVFANVDRLTKTFVMWRLGGSADGGTREWHQSPAERTGYDDTWRWRGILAGRGGRRAAGRNGGRRRLDPWHPDRTAACRSAAA